MPAPRRARDRGPPQTGAPSGDLEGLVAGIEERHGRFLFSRDGTTIDEQLADLLEGHKIATGESCTGGLLAARLTELDGASAYVQGGAVTYSNEAKTEALGVPPR